MKFTVDNIYHVYNQGNNRQIIFKDDYDYTIFLRMVNQLISPYAQIISWCLMPNHFHFLIYTDERSVVLVKQGGLVIESLTNGIRKLLSGYARMFNNKYQQTGSLFRQKTKAKNILETETIVNKVCSFTDYCAACFWYIHQNPVMVGLVDRPEDWKWSSYLDYSGKRNGKLVNKQLAIKYCNLNKIDFKDADESWFENISKDLL